MADASSLKTEIIYEIEDDIEYEEGYTGPGV